MPDLEYSPVVVNILCTSVNSAARRLASGSCRSTGSAISTVICGRCALVSPLGLRVDERLAIRRRITGWGLNEKFCEQCDSSRLQAVGRFSLREIREKAGQPNRLVLDFLGASYGMRTPVSALERAAFISVLMQSRTRQPLTLRLGRSRVSLPRCGRTRTTSVWAIPSELNPSRRSHCEGTAWHPSPIARMAARLR
jgi:hypothetical protein